MKTFLLQLVIFCLLGIVIYGLYNYKLKYNFVKEKEYQNKIDSLQTEIGLNKIKIDSLSTAKIFLDSLVAVDKAKLIKVAKRAEIYRKKYNEEYNRLNDMSDDDIISEFTATFQ
jgi:hypothetical protein